MQGPEDTSEQDSRQQLQTTCALRSSDLHGTCIDDVDFVTWPVMHQRIAFYAGVYVPKVGFTLSPEEISEYKALIQKGNDYEQNRIEKGGLPKALTLKYLRGILG